MGIYDIPEVSKEIKALSIRRLIASGADYVKDLERRHTAIFNIIWFNEDFTPQEIMDMYGTSAYLLFQDSLATQEFLQKVILNYKFLIPPYKYTINKDGSVTIGDKIAL